jgi:uncharacterized Tic20 family protein
MTPAAAAEQPSSEARQLAMIAHLLGVANFAFAFAGLIGVIILYVTAKDDFVRVNARAALNMQITWLIYGGIFIVLYFFAFFSLFASSAFVAHPQFNSAVAGLPTFAIMFSIFGMIFLGMIVTAIMNGVGARRAYLGRVFRYPIAIPFLRDPVFSEPGTAA